MNPMRAFKIALFAIIIHIVGGLLLPLALYLEFGTADSDGNHASFSFLLEHYSHITVFGSAFGIVPSAALVCASWIMSRRYGWGMIAGVAAVSLVVGGVFAFSDLHGDQMLLLEFSKEGQGMDGRFLLVDSAVSQAGVEIDHRSADNIFSRASITDTAHLSHSRMFYGLTLAYVVGMVSYVFLLVALTCGQGKFPEKRKTVCCLAIAATFLSFWFLFRIHFNESVKAPVFGPESVNAIWERLPGIGWNELAGLTLLSIIVVVIVWRFTEEIEKLEKIIGRMAALIPSGISIAAVATGFVKGIGASQQTFVIWCLTLSLIAISIPFFTISSHEESHPEN